jgi:hypothetical protein
MTVLGPRRREGTGKRGQALVEFALVAPVFFLVLFAIIEAGRFMFYYETLNHVMSPGPTWCNGSGTRRSVFSAQALP